MDRGDGQFPDAAAVVDRTRSRTVCGLATATARWPDNHADIPRPNRDHFADSKTCLLAGVRRALDKTVRSGAGLVLRSAHALAVARNGTTFSATLGGQTLNHLAASGSETSCR